MAKYKKRNGEEIELSDKEFMGYPYNSKLTKIETKQITKKKTKKKDILEDE